MKATETQLKVLLEGQKQFRIPLFQRTYSWTEGNWDALWNDVLETYEDGLDNRHFLGSVVTKSLPGTPEGVSPFLVIDGQQRLTTLTILLTALSDHAKSELPDLAKKIDDLYLKNVYASALDVYKILPTQADRPAYFSVIDRKTANETLSRVQQAYDHFRRKLHDGKNGSPINLKSLEQIIVSGLEVVSITLGDSDNEYRIFESLNTTGTRLTQADLIRNYFFMQIPHNQQDQVYTDLWLPMQLSLGDSLEDFFRYQLLSEGQFVRESDVYQKWKEKLAKLNSDELIRELKRLLHDSELYKRIISPDLEKAPTISARIARLNRWRGETIYPFLLNIYRHYDAHELDAEGFARVLLILESFLVRRFFVGIPTNALNRLFLRLYQQLPEGLDLVEGTKVVLSEQGKRWPRDEEFYQAMLSFPLYINGQYDQRRFILETFESYFKHKESPDLSSVTIEHIMPQALSPEWLAALGVEAEALHEKFVHTTGNLTLTAYNPELSNSLFEVKRGLLKDSNLQMNKEIAEETEWTFKQIEERGRCLAERALQIWPGPEK